MRKRPVLFLWLNCGGLPHARTKNRLTVESYHHYVNWSLRHWTHSSCISLWHCDDNWNRKYNFWVPKVCLQSVYLWTISRLQRQFYLKFATRGSRGQIKNPTKKNDPERTARCPCLAAWPNDGNYSTRKKRYVSRTWQEAAASGSFYLILIS